MLKLITGEPGGGKTLLAVEIILAAAKSRPVFTNINGFQHEKVGTFPLEDPIKWMELPEGALIVIDEAQGWFRPRHSTAKVPPHVEALETHRHHGFDIIFITQHPSFIDAHVRRLVSSHQHCFRAFGLRSRAVLNFETCNDDPVPKSALKSVRTERKPFDKNLYSYYKSTAKDTTQVHFPRNIIYMILFGVLAVAYGIYSYVAPKVDIVANGSNITNKEHSVSSNSSPVIASPTIPDYSNLPVYSFVGRFGGSIFVRDGSGRLVSLASFDYRLVPGRVVLFLGESAIASVVDIRLTTLLEGSL